MSDTIGRCVRAAHPNADWPALLATLKRLWEDHTSALDLARIVRQEHGVQMSHVTAAKLARTVSTYRPGVGAPGRKRANTCVDCPTASPWRCRRCAAAAQRRRRERGGMATMPTEPLRRPPPLRTPEQPLATRAR